MIAITDIEKNTVYLNPRFIISIEEVQEGDKTYTIIQCENRTIVTETPAEEILKQMQM